MKIVVTQGGAPVTELGFDGNGHVASIATAPVAQAADPNDQVLIERDGELQKISEAQFAAGNSGQIEAEVEQAVAGTLTAIGTAESNLAGTVAAQASTLTALQAGLGTEASRAEAAELADSAATGTLAGRVTGDEATLASTGTLAAAAKAEADSETGSLATEGASLGTLTTRVTGDEATLTSTGTLAAAAKSEADSEAASLTAQGGSLSTLSAGLTGETTRAEAAETANSSAIGTLSGRVTGDEATLASTGTLAVAAKAEADSETGSLAAQGANLGTLTTRVTGDEATLTSTGTLAAAAKAEADSETGSLAAQGASLGTLTTRVTGDEATLASTGTLAAAAKAEADSDTASLSAQGGSLSTLSAGLTGETTRAEAAETASSSAIGTLSGRVTGDEATLASTGTLAAAAKAEADSDATLAGTAQTLAAAAQPKNGDLRTNLLSATSFNPGNGITGLNALLADWIVREHGPHRLIDSFEHNGGAGSVPNTFLDTNSMADAVATNRIAAGVGTVNPLAVANAAVAWCFAAATFLIFTPRLYNFGAPLLWPDPTATGRILWRGQPGARIIGGFDTGSSVNGYIDNTTKRDLSKKAQAPVMIGIDVWQKFSFAVHGITNLPVEPHKWWATTGGDCTGLTNPLNGQPVSAGNLCTWVTSATQLAAASGSVLYFDTPPPISVSSPLWTNTASQTNMMAHHLFFLNQGVTPAGPPTQVTIGAWTGWQLTLNAPNINPGLVAIHNSGIGGSNPLVRNLIGATAAAAPIAASSSGPSQEAVLALAAPAIIFYTGMNARGQGPTPVFWQGTGFGMGSDGGLFIDCETVGICNGQGWRTFGDRNTYHRQRVMSPDPRNSCGGQMWIAGNDNHMYDAELHGGDDCAELVTGNIANGALPKAPYDMANIVWHRLRAFSWNARGFVLNVGAGATSALHIPVTSSGAAPAMSPNTNLIYFDEGAFSPAQVAQLQASVAAAPGGPNGAQAANLMTVYSKYYIQSGSAYVSGYSDNGTLITITLTDPTQAFAIMGNKNPIPLGTKLTFGSGNNGSGYSVNTLNCGVLDGYLVSGNNNGLTIGNAGSTGEATGFLCDVVLDMRPAAWTTAYTSIIGIKLNGGFAGGLQLKARNVRVFGPVTQCMFANGVINDLDIQDSDFSPPPVAGVSNLQLSGFARLMLRNNRIWATPGGQAVQLGQAADTQDNLGDVLPQSAARINVLNNQLMGCQDGQAAIQMLRCSLGVVRENAYYQSTQLGFGNAAALSYDTTSTGLTIDGEDYTWLDAVAPIVQGSGATSANATIGFGLKQNPTPPAANGAYAAITPVPPPALAALIAAAIPGAIAALPRESATNPLQQGVAMIEAGGAVVVPQANQ